MLQQAVLLPMTSGAIIGMGVVVILLICSALISGSEVAFFSLEPRHLSELREKASRREQLVLSLLEKPDRLLANILISNNFINVGIVIIASFVTIVDLTMQAYFPALSESLGIFIPLIVVNCIILGRAEGFASKNGVFSSIVDAIGMGVGFTFALVAIAFFREALGNGTLLNINLFGQTFEPVILMILPPGAFLVVGLYLGFFNWLDERKAGKRSS